MPTSRRLIALLLLIALPSAPHAVQAQRTRTATSAMGPLVIRARGSAAPVSRGRTPAPPGQLAPSAQVSMARASLGNQTTITGIGAQLRLTPARPFVPNQGELRTSMALSVDPDASGGVITLQPDVVGSPGGPEVEVHFRPTLPNQPVLVDFVLRVSSVNAPVGVYLSGHGIKDHRALAEGDQHVTALVIPGDTGWYTVSLTLDKSQKYQRVWLYAVQLTTLK